MSESVNIFKEVVIFTYLIESILVLGSELLFMFRVVTLANEHSFDSNYLAQETSMLNFQIDMIVKWWLGPGGAYQISFFIFVRKIITQDKMLWSTTPKQHW